MRVLVVERSAPQTSWSGCTFVLVRLRFVVVPEVCPGQERKKSCVLPKVKGREKWVGIFNIHTDALNTTGYLVLVTTHRTCSPVWGQDGGPVVFVYNSAREVADPVTC